MDIIINFYPVILFIYITLMIVLYIVAFLKIKFSSKEVEQKLYLVNMVVFILLLLFFMVTLAFKYDKVYTDKPIWWEILSPIFFIIREFYMSLPAMVFQLIWQSAIIKKLYKPPFQNK
jgi:cytochrome bd-type quinol oxidase subunit 2